MASGTPVISAVPGKAGQYTVNALGTVVQLTQLREGDFFDTVQFQGATSLQITPGTELVLFRDLTNKNIQDMNLGSQYRIPAQNEMVITKFGVVILQAYGSNQTPDSDVLQIAYNASLQFYINERKLGEGALVNYPIGYGVTGSTTRNNTGIVTLGVASPAAIPGLVVPQPIGDQDSLKGSIFAKDNSWMVNNGTTTASQKMTVTTNVCVRFHVHGVIKIPLGA